MSAFDPSEPTNAAVKGPPSNLAEARQDRTAYAFEPPTYEEAIGFASDPSEATQWNVQPVLWDELQGAAAYDMEDEQAYEESRPLKTGVVPNAPAQYTFIQPQDHTRQKWWRMSKSHSQKYHYHDHTALYAPPNVHPPPLPLQLLPTYQHPSEPFAGIPTVPGNQGLMNAQDISIADFVRTSSGDESVDPILENDPYQLYRYFVAHNDRPEMYLLITGYHVEQRETVSTDSKGNRTTSSRDENVEDFRIEFDLTPFVNPRGVLYTSPDPNTGRERSLRQVFDEHAQDDNEFKELHLKKAVQWDYEELTRAITHAIRSAHYRFNVEVSFPLKNDRVKVASSSPLAKFMRNPWTKAFCFVGVVGVVFYPIRECYKRVRKESIKSSFEMTLSTREFYQANYWSIVDQVRYK
ncbi:hypothetical protein BGZ59_000079 [Podila verticillata]|nr:hypothetical protein BGZ59_000079 [Podila verticillata]